MYDFDCISINDFLVDTSNHALSNIAFVCLFGTSCYTLWRIQKTESIITPHKSDAERKQVCFTALLLCWLIRVGSHDVGRVAAVDTEILLYYLLCTPYPF